MLNPHTHIQVLHAQALAYARPLHYTYSLAYIDDKVPTAQLQTIPSPSHSKNEIDVIRVEYCSFRILKEVHPNILLQSSVPSALQKAHTKKIDILVVGTTFIKSPFGNILHLNYFPHYVNFHIHSSEFFLSTLTPPEGMLDDNTKNKRKKLEDEHERLEIKTL